MTDLQQITRNLAAARAHQADVEAEMQELEELGMYPVQPTESWQSRDGGENKYLYMYFPMNADGSYAGPNGKRKLYVGCSETRIAQARAWAERRRRYSQLALGSQRLAYWIKEIESSMTDLVRRSARWPTVNLGTDPAAGGVAGGPNNKEMEVSR